MILNAGSANALELDAHRYSAPNSPSRPSSWQINDKISSGRLTPEYEDDMVFGAPKKDQYSPMANGEMRGCDETELVAMEDVQTACCLSS
jgi:hypothetical protein